MRRHWKRVKLANHFGFSCNTHVRNKTACSMKTIAEEPVKAAFITLMNKLTYGRSLILIPYAEMLKSSQRSGNIDRLTELDEMLEKNTERRSQITQFFTKGCLTRRFTPKRAMILRRRQTDCQKREISLLRR